MLERGARHEGSRGRSRRRRPRSSSRPRTTSTSTTSGCGTCARSATARASTLPEWEELRSLASAIKEHTLTHLGDYLEEFERNATANGARRALGARRRRAQPDRARHPERTRRDARWSRAKSMLTDECEMRPFLENRGIEVMETDLGERIQQLDDEPPSHIVVPAVHKLRDDVAEVFADTIGTDPQEQRRPLPGREPAPAHAALLPEGRRRHDRRQLRRRRDRQRRRLHQRGQRRPRASNLPQAHIASIGIEKLHSPDRASRRLRPDAVAQRAGLADHAAHLALPRAARPAPRCTSCWSTTAAPSASAWRTSGTR